LDLGLDYKGKKAGWLSRFTFPPIAKSAMDGAPDSETRALRQWGSVKPLSHHTALGPVIRIRTR